MKSLIAALAVVGFPITLSGCSSADPGDVTACQLYEGGYNDLASAVDAYHAHKDTDAETYQALTLAATATFQSDLDLAIDKAADATLVSELARSRDFRLRADAGDEDAGVAFFLHMPDVVTACADAGVDIELAD